MAGSPEPPLATQVSCPQLIRLLRASSLIGVQYVTMLMYPCSPVSLSPSKQSRGSACKAAATAQPAHPPLVAERMPEALPLSLTAPQCDGSDDGTWESESFESTLSSIADFDMDGALDRMASGDRFYTPEPAESIPLAGDIPSACKDIQQPHAGRSARENSELNPPEGSSLEETQSGGTSFARPLHLRQGTGVHVHEMTDQVLVNSPRFCWQTSLGAELSHDFLHCKTSGSSEGRLCAVIIIGQISSVCCAMA